MDHQKEKLKNRLNLRFSPSDNNPSHRYSLKKLSIERKSINHSSQEQQSTLNASVNRAKSISTLNVKLPSLQKLITNEISPVKNKQSNNSSMMGVMELLKAKQKIRTSSIKLNKIEQTDRHGNTQTVNQSTVSKLSKLNYGQSHNESTKYPHPIINNSINTSILSKSILTITQSPTKKPVITPHHLKQSPTRPSLPLPQALPQSKSSIHQTLTFLIKNQILTIPKIVALLQKSHSDEFLYMKVRGIYQFQVCDQSQKGKDFVTVSRSGMVADGEIIPLEQMIHQFQFYEKVRKITFFRQFVFCKFLNKWHKGSRKAQLVQNRNNLYKLLHLDQPKLLKWGLQLKQYLSLTQVCGSIKPKWVPQVIQIIEDKRYHVLDRLSRICFEMLEEFELPINDSTELMNKVLYDLSQLSISFQIKIRIEKNLEAFYRFGRCLELVMFSTIGQFILDHLQSLSEKIRRSTAQYQSLILSPLQSLTFEHQTYSTLKQQILINSPLSYDIQFTLSIDQISQELQIHPSAEELHESFLESLDEFYLQVQKQEFKLVRNDRFKFLMNVINKSIVPFQKQLEEKTMTVKDYVKQLKSYETLLQQLQELVYAMKQVFTKRQKLNTPFLQLYKQLKLKNLSIYEQQCFQISFRKQLQELEQHKQLLTKLHEGQYFIFGYMNQSSIKTLIMKEINTYEQKIMLYIPEMVETERRQLQVDMNQHLKRISKQIIRPDQFIQVVNQSQQIQDKLPEYSSKVLQLDKIMQLYTKRWKKPLPFNITNEKLLLNDLRTRLKNFKERKQTIYFEYRRQLQLQRKHYIQRTEQLSQPQAQFYTPQKQSSEHQFLSMTSLRSEHESLSLTSVYGTSLPAHTQSASTHQKIIEILKFLTQIQRQLKHFNELEIYFNLKETIIPKLQMLIVQYQTLEEIWKIYKEWQQGLKTYGHKLGTRIPATKQVIAFETYVRKLQRWMKSVEYFEICKYLHENVSIYLNSMLFIQEIQFQNLRQQDYQEMNKLLTKQWQLHQKKQPLSFQKIISSSLSLIKKDNPKLKFQIQINVKQLTLDEIIAKKLYPHKHLLEEVTFKCRKQLEIKQMLQSFEAWWKALRLTGKPLDEYPLIYVFETNDNIRRQIDEYTTVLVNILNHKYGASVRKQCLAHLKNMNYLTELLRLTIQHQQKFLSLYPILTSKYAEKQLVQEYKKFDLILNKTMRNTRWLIKPTQNLNQATKNFMINHIKHFDSILKYLSDFLQKKRIRFQRFYFLQDNEMLQLLVGNDNDNHVFRMFQGIKGWLEDDQGIKVGVVGVGGQQLKLKGWVYKIHEPQIHFRSLQDSIKSNLNSIVRKILHAYESQLKELRPLYHKTPWMCIYTVELILYTKQIQLNCFYDNISFELQKNLIRENILGASASPSDNSNYITLQLFLLHFTEQLQKQNVTSVFHFEWYSFLKYYHENNLVVMRSLGEEHSWGGEYQGLWNLMINTSDIRRVNACVLSNLKNANGVLLQGPSGTGKTESLKELSRCMAKYCLIFNCSSEVNVQTLQKLLSGLCYTASWICLDQINRLNAQIMSVIANQINTIKNALMAGKQMFNFMGKKMHLKKGIGVFSTMNPIYLQRSKLTENLKSYFRVITVNAPDYEKIMEVMLYSLNYTHASSHAQKIARIFKNLSFQLGDHPQYDFGMRAIKVFIKNLAKHKHINRKEEQTIFHALYETFYTRLNPSDFKTFAKVIKDILGFSIDNHAIQDKVQSIRQSTQTGTIILGPTSCKTTLISEYLKTFKQKVHIQIYNTISLQSKYLLGQNVLGRWNPGVMEKMAKQSLQNQKQMHILVLDNKLKSEVIENFNTLLDESKLLTLANGTRIKIHDNFKLIMQTPNLTMTSPATITRCHVIYVSLQDVSKTSVVNSILPNLPPSSLQRVSGIFKNFTVEQVLRVGCIYPLFWKTKIQHKVDQMRRKYVDRAKLMNLNENQLKGLQKVIFYTIQLLNLSAKVKGIMTKQNTIPFKKSAENFWVSFQKYQQGQFIEVLCSPEPQKTRFSTFIPTISSQFCYLATKSAINKNMPLFWSGKSMIGKSASIKRAIAKSLEQIKPNQRKFIEIPIDQMLTSKKITEIFDDKMSIRNNAVNEQIVVYVENVNMSMQESEQLFRYFAQYSCLFSQKSKDLAQVPKIANIFDCNHEKSKWISRLTRHFAQIPFPQLNENQIEDLYTQIIKFNVSRTRTSSLFKENLIIEIGKISIFLTDYVKKKNKLLHGGQNDGHELKFGDRKYFSHFQLLSVLNNIKCINQKFIKDSNDFMQFFLCDLRRHQLQLTLHSKQQRQKLLDTLKLSFNQSYKQKYEEQYNHSFKSLNGHPKEVSFFTSTITGLMHKIQWSEFRTKMYLQLSQKYYMSEFMVVQLIYIIRTLQYQGGHYILVGKEGLGKKNLFLMAAQICLCKVKNFDAVEEYNFASAYFSVLKDCFLKSQKMILILDTNAKNYSNLLLFLQRVRSGYPLKFMFKPQEIDEAFTLMQQAEDLNYHQSMKSYQEVVQDFFRYANEKIHIFISCRSEKITQTLKKHHFIAKRSTVRLVDDFPSESITQISLKILEENMLEKQNAKRLSSVFLKLYEDLETLISENIKIKGYSYFKHNAICQFKLLERYAQIEKTVVEKLKKRQDTLNRTILKVQQTEKILQKLNHETVVIRQEIQKKQQKIKKYQPLVEEKKSLYEQMKQSITVDKKEILHIQQQADQLLTQIQAKSKSMQPFVKEASDSLLSVKRSDFTELKSSHSLHPILKFTLEVILVLLGQEQSEENIKKLVSDINVIQRMKSCHPSIIHCKKTREKIVSRQDWNFESLSKVAFSMRYLYKWILNTLKAYEIKDTVECQKRELEKLKRQIQKEQAQVEKKYSELIVIEGQLHVVDEKYMNSKNSLTALLERLDNCTRKLHNASKVQGSLELYMTEWKDKIKQGKELRKNLQFIASKYTYFMKIHPFLQQEDRKSLEEKLDNNLKKAMFPFPSHFSALDFLKQQLHELQSQRLSLKQQSENLQSNKTQSLYSLSSLSHSEASNQNLIFLLRDLSERPILFDPDNQALKWLQTRIQSINSEDIRSSILTLGQSDDYKMVITRSSFSNASKSVELCIKEGYLLVLLIEDNMDEFTSEVLTSKVTQSMNRTLMQYNKNLLYVHPTFNLILCNRSRKPNPSVSYFIGHQVINFQITRDFLFAQLINSLLVSQTQVLYKAKMSLESERKVNNDQLGKIELQVIQSLINNKKQLVDDDELIVLLQSGEERSQVLKDNAGQLNQKMVQIQAQLKLFDSVCQRASQIFSSLKIMSRVSEFFSWNVEIFIAYFLNACKQSITKPLFNAEDSEDDFDYNEGSLLRPQNYEFDNYIGHGNSRATSALSYVSAVTSKVHLEDRKNDFQEQNQEVIKQVKQPRTSRATFNDLIGQQQTFLEQEKRGTMTRQREEKIIQLLLSSLKHAFNQPQKLTWSLILSLIDHPESDIKMLLTESKHKDDIKDYIENKEITKNMKEQFKQLDGTAKMFANQVAIHPRPFQKYSQRFNELQILLLCKLLKPERFHELVMQLISMKGYRKILEYQKVGVQDWLTVSDSVHPILLMMGEDPLPKLTEYLGRKKYKNVILLAMGEGQSTIAQIVLQKQSKKQNVVIIHNLHISPQFYTFLSKTLQQFQTRKPHQNFRLILITSISTPFDISIASSCHKFLISQPTGLKNQMKYLYEEFPIEMKEIPHKKLGFSLCLFHSVVNELKKYQSLGWTTPFDFSSADFLNSIKILKELLESRANLNNFQCNIEKEDLKEIVEDRVDFDGLKYLIGQVNYVGKLTNKMDRQKMRIFIKTFISQGVLENGFKFFNKYELPSKFNKSFIFKAIDQISQNNEKLYGLHDDIKPSSQSMESILLGVKECFAVFAQEKANLQSRRIEALPSINHKFEFINSEIEKFNSHLLQTQGLMSHKQQDSIVGQTHAGNYVLLKQIKPDTRVFDLRTFSNPHQFFIQIQKEAALRLQIQFQKVEMVYSLIPRENVAVYGIKNLTLEGASLNRTKEGSFLLDAEGKEETNITLYLLGTQNKKKQEVQSNRKLVKIPLYMSHKRQGEINSYGDNTNLLTIVTVEAQEDADFWALRSAAFIADRQISQK